jgi:uncharacterized protein
MSTAGQHFSHTLHAEAMVASPPSPCISLCQMSLQTGWCEGCYRNIEEIASWSGMSAAEKQAVWQSIDQRAQSLIA